MADEKEKKADKSTPPPPVPATSSKLVPLKFNYRYQNINAGEVAGYPEAEAAELLKKEVSIGDKTVRVCERYEPK